MSEEKFKLLAETVPFKFHYHNAPQESKIFISEKPSPHTPPPGMRIRTGGARRTESSQIVHAEHAAHVTMAAVGAVAAEPPVVPRTVPHLGLGVNVEEGTLFVVAGVEA